MTQLLWRFGNHGDVDFQHAAQALLSIQGPYGPYGHIPPRRVLWVRQGDQSTPRRVGIVPGHMEKLARWCALVTSEIWMEACGLSGNDRDVVRGYLLEKNYRRAAVIHLAEQARMELTRAKAQAASECAIWFLSSRCVEHRARECFRRAQFIDAYLERDRLRSTLALRRTLCWAACARGVLRADECPLRGVERQALAVAADEVQLGLRDPLDAPSFVRPFSQIEEAA